VVHMGFTPCKNAPMKFQHPYLLDDVAARFPNLRVVIAHVGWPWVEECLAVVAKWENFHVDFAYWGWFGAETTFQTVKRIGDLCGYDKLCFGSENSHTHMAVGMFQSFGEVAKTLGVNAISPENMEKIMWKNTARLWKIDPKVQVLSRWIAAVPTIDRSAALVTRLGYPHLSKNGPYQHMTWIMKAFHQFEVVDIRTTQQLLQTAGFGKTGREFLCLALELVRVVIGISKQNGAVDLLWMKSRAVLHHLPFIELHVLRAGTEHDGLEEIRSANEGCRADEVVSALLKSCGG